MIQVDNLGIEYGGRSLFTKASFSLQKGEKCGLVGRNGSGKSTFLRLITKQEKPYEGAISIQKNYRIGMLDQHIRFSKETLLEEAALGLPKGQEDCLYLAETVLFGLGFKEEDLNRSIEAFSGGYQLRLHLAKVLISEPDCLLLDEPTNYLDITSIRWFTRFLQNWKGELILISHDREFMDSVTTHTMGIHREKIKKIIGDTVAFYEKILLEEEIHEKTRINLEKKRSHAQNFIDRFGAKATKAAQAESRKKMLSRIPVLERLKEIHHLDFLFKEVYFPGKKMLEVQDLSFSYKEDPLIQDFSLTLEKGERVAIVGKNGRGKSTLLRLLAKELTPKHGIVKQSENLAIGYFGQTNIDRLHPKHTIEEEISAANPALNRTEIKGIAGLMMFSGDQAGKYTEVLSGGEKSRVLLGKIIAKPANLLLLDEPTHHLDMESIEALIDALEEFKGAAILVTHSELILKRLTFDKIVVCHEGRQEVFLGDYEDFLEKDGWHDKEKESPSSKKKEKILTSVKKNQKSSQTIEREILEKELRIAELEKERATANTLLLECLQDNQTVKIQELNGAILEKSSRIEQLLVEIEVLFADL